MDYTVTNIQYIEEVGILVDLHVQNQTTLKNGTPMHQPIQLSVPIDGDETSTIAEIHRKALKKAAQCLQEAADFFGKEG